jgi:hypothetical protein
MMERTTFPPGEGPTVYTADLCQMYAARNIENPHELCKGIDKVEGTEDSVFCICWCHKKAEVV